jgi:D-alanine-D-alanine ligase-like ATP-grasp enzyme
MMACINEEADVKELGFRIARALRLEVGSVDIVRDVDGNLWPIDVNVVPAFRVWAEGYSLLADYLARKAEAVALQSG